MKEEMAVWMKEKLKELTRDELQQNTIQNQNIEKEAM